MADWPQCVTLLSAQKHTFFYRTGIFSTLFVHIFLIVVYQRSFGVLKSGISIASLFSGNLSRSQTAFCHSHTWRNRLTLHNFQTSDFHFISNELKLFLKKDFLFRHPSPHSCLISDEPHIGIIVSWPMTLKVDFL